MTHTDDERSLARVIGKNARRLRIRAGLTLDQVAIATRQLGLKWSESRVADFEAGKVAPNLATLLTVCLAFSDLGCKATLADLIASGEPIQISESLYASEEELLRLLSGRRRRPSKRGGPSSMAQPPKKGLTPKGNADSFPLAEMSNLVLLAPTLMATDGATEARVRKSLGIPPDKLAELSMELWGRSFAEERDRRAHKSANAQARGQVSRRMLTELSAALGSTDKPQNHVPRGRKDEHSQ